MSQQSQRPTNPKRDWYCRGGLATHLKRASAQKPHQHGGDNNEVTTSMRGCAGIPIGEGFMGWKANALLVLFVLAVMAFALLGVMRTEATGDRLHMTKQEVTHVMTDLKKRSASDCVLTRTETGFQCREMATGKVFKVEGK